MKHIIRTKEFTTTRKTALIDAYTRGKAIKAFCTECLGYDDSPSDCTAVLCPLFPFRGKTLVAYQDGEHHLEIDKGYSVVNKEVVVELNKE